MLDHYLHTAHCRQPGCSTRPGPRVLDPPGAGVAPETISGPSDALAWFEAERQVLLAAITQAGGHWASTLHAWQLPWALWLFFDRQGYWHDQVAIQHTAIAAAQAPG